jgi:hypothetical protein
MLAAAGLLGVALLAGCSDTGGAAASKAALSGKACGVSELKANPDAYLGSVTVTGKASRVFAEDGVIQIADEKACCAVYLFVPFTEAQRDKLGSKRLYQGTLPEIGASITADAELTKREEGYVLEVRSIRSGDGMLIAMR